MIQCSSGRPDLAVITRGIGSRGAPQDTDDLLAVS